MYQVSPWNFLTFFPRRLGIFSPNFTRLLYVSIYARLQIFIQLSATLTVRICLGELCVWHVETLLTSRRVNAGKFCYCMTLLSYLLPVKWRQHQYAKLINEFLANFLLHLPYRKCCLILNAAAADAATGVCDVDKWSQWEANECTRSAPSNPQLVLLGGCRSGEEISVRRLQNYLASEHYFTLCSRASFPELTA